MDLTKQDAYRLSPLPCFSFTTLHIQSFVLRVAQLASVLRQKTDQKLLIKKAGGNGLRKDYPLFFSFVLSELRHNDSKEVEHGQVRQKGI